MPVFDINDIAKIGSVRDIPSYMLPPEAWTVALNMRYDDQSIRTIEGWAQIFGTPLSPPHFGMGVVKAGSLLDFTAGSIIAYAGLDKIRWYDGTSHTDATRTVGGDYTATHTRQWNGAIAGGGILIFNNGVDVPQFSGTPGSGTFENMTNWPPALRAKVVRSFGPHLFAINLVDGATAHPHRFRWSHPADPGSLPSSWDVTDPTKDAGQKDLPDTHSGLLLDGLTLGSVMYLYKETSIWRTRFVGGQEKFDIGQSAWINSEGLLGMGMVCVTGDGQKHVFATTSGDIMWHNGNQIQSILTLRQRRRLQGDIDPANARNSFIFANPFTHSVWFCYPSQGNVWPDKALHLSYKNVGGTEWSVTEVDGITFRNTLISNLPVQTGDVWDSVVGTWDSYDGVWGQPQIRRNLILLDPANTKFYGLGDSELRDGVAFSSQLRREGLGVIGKRRSGEPIVDFQVQKMIKMLMPKVRGGAVTVRFNSQQVVEGPVSDGLAAAYDPTTQTHVYPHPMSGVAVGFDITGTGHWALDGYKVDIEPMGEF